MSAAKHTPVPRDPSATELQEIYLSSVGGSPLNYALAGWRARAAEDADLLAALQRLLPAYRSAVKLNDPNIHDALTVDAHNAIARATGSAA